MANISRRIPGLDVPSLQVSIHIEKLALMNKINADWNTLPGIIGADSVCGSHPILSQDRFFEIRKMKKRWHGASQRQFMKALKSGRFGQDQAHSLAMVIFG